MAGDTQQNAATIRRADPSDAAAIAEVLREAFAPTRHLYTEQAYRVTAITPDEVLDRMREGPVWVALVPAGRSVGIGATVSAVVSGDALVIRGMASRPVRAGRGLGRALLEVLEAHAITLALARLELCTTPFLDRAIELYERFGFERGGSAIDTLHGRADLHGTPLIPMFKDVADDRSIRLSPLPDSSSSNSEPGS